jgi:murein L,D-transpeptidase YafK
VKISFIIIALILAAVFTVRNMAQTISSTLKVDKPRIVIHKKARRLELFDGEVLVKTYTIALGSQPIGDKEIEGDGKTPEGKFYVFTKNDRSKFYLSLGLSYPDTKDANRGLAAKLITKPEHDAIADAIAKREMPPQYTKLGGEIYIHGGGTNGDWTLGCIALKNEDIKELFDVIPTGTVVEIRK